MFFHKLFYLHEIPHKFFQPFASFALTFSVKLVLNKRVLIIQDKGHWTGEEICWEGRKPECLHSSWIADMMRICKYLFGPTLLHSSFSCSVIYVFVHSHSSLQLCKHHSNLHLSAVPTQTDLGIPLIHKQSGIIRTSALKGNLYPRSWSQWDKGQEKYIAVMWI